MLKNENKQKDNYMNEILENANYGQKEAQDILYGFEAKNKSIDKKSNDFGTTFLYTNSKSKTVYKRSSQYWILPGHLMN